MLRVTALWSGFIGSPGYSNFYFDGPTGTVGDNAITAQNCADAVRRFFNEYVSFLPQNTTVQVQQTVTEINAANGELTSEYGVATAPLPVVGGGVGSYSAPTGACIVWRTSTIAAGKKLRGKTFLVPLSGGAFENNGTLISTFLAKVPVAAAHLTTIPLSVLHSLHVWHRPGAGGPGSTGKVIGATCADRGAVLRSRRG